MRQLTKSLLIALHMCTFEGSFAEIRQVIAGTKFGSFLTPVMAPKNYAKHGIDCSLVRQPDSMSAIVFDGMSGVQKLLGFHAEITCPTSAFNASFSQCHRKWAST